MSRKIAVLGAGIRGLLLASVLAGLGHEVLLYSGESHQSAASYVDDATLDDDLRSAIWQNVSACRLRFCSGLGDAIRFGKYQILIDDIPGADRVCGLSKEYLLRETLSRAIAERHVITTRESVHDALPALCGTDRSSVARTPDFVVRLSCLPLSFPVHQTMTAFLEANGSLVIDLASLPPVLGGATPHPSTRHDHQFDAIAYLGSTK